ncbi:MAG TPA: hypothetical protein VFA80_19060 [Xanthobacteraceae bacterium]|nr:hypothetical protein [Xanthobacteraceae bacterium]
MANRELYRERAEACRRKAEAISDARDRAKWLKLAADWMALSEVPFQTGSSQSREENPFAGLWRGAHR